MLTTFVRSIIATPLIPARVLSTTVTPDTVQRFIREDTSEKTKDLGYALLFSVGNEVRPSAYVHSFDEAMKQSEELDVPFARVVQRGTEISLVKVYNEKIPKTK